ncbi:MAG: single-stranded DNA-binding protein [Candidatus Latescibacteria bacterium]|nr:single-stranded DNA-binding protein [Candidatus Latescibacterota bacterium]
MSRGLNKVMLIGNLGSDPEIRSTGTGLQVANFRMATNEQFSTRDGERQQRTEWHRIVAFGKLAEICGQYLKKGSQLYAEGRIQTREWEDQSGNRRFTTEVVLREMVMLGSAGGGGDYSPPSDDDSQEEESTVEIAADEDDDLPF